MPDRGLFRRMGRLRKSGLLRSAAARGAPCRWVLAALCRPLALPATASGGGKRVDGIKTHAFNLDAIMKRRENEVERKPTFNNDSKTSKNEKNAFDKRKHRLKKYSNRYKVDQWQERRKRAVLRGYYKETSKDRCARQKGTETKVETRSGNSDSSGPKKSPSFFDVARKEYERKKEETLRVKAEREEALRKYKERKMQAYKKLSKRTKKGQPVMKDRIELLLQKIQQDKAN